MTTDERIFHLRVDEVRVGDRHRHDLGDLHSLANSIDNVGLLHPILVTPDSQLIAGQRRLEAARLLGWLTVPTRVVDLEDLLQAEHDENVIRKDFTPTEAVTIGRALEPAHRERVHDQNVALGKAQQAKLAGQTADGKRSTPVGTTREVVGRAVRLSGSSYDRARRVMDAAEQDPAQFGDLPTLMDQTSILAAHKELQRRLGKEPPKPKEKPTSKPMELVRGSKHKPPQVVAARVIDMLEVAGHELAQLPLDALTQEGRERLLRQLTSTIRTLNKVRTTIKERPDVA